MTEYKLYINDQQVDLLEADIPISFGITEIGEESTRKANKTGMIKVPDTMNNREILGWRYDPNISKNITTDEGLVTDGSFTFQGKVIYYESIILDSKIIYQLQIVSGNGDWVIDLDGVNMSGVAMTTIEHTYSVANVNASETSGGDYVYPLINFGAFSGDNGTVALSDRIPAVKIYAILNAIFAQVGYKISSTFLETADFKKWFTAKSQLEIYTKVSADASLFKAGRSADESYNQTINTGSGWPLYFFAPVTNWEIVHIDEDAIDPNFDNGSNFNTSTHRYTASAEGSVRFYAKLYVRLAWDNEISNHDITFTGNILKNGASIASDSQDYNWSSGETNTVVILEMDSGYLKVVATDYFEVKLTVAGYVDSSMDSRKIYCYVKKGENTIFYNSAILRPASGYSWTDELLLPSVSALDFLKAINNLFNLVYLTNLNQKLVYIEPEEDFHSGTAMDWSSKLDTSRSIEVHKLAVPVMKKYRLKLDGNDVVITNYEIQVAFANGIEKEESISNDLFAATLMDYAREIGLSATQIPKMWHEIAEYPAVPAQFMNYVTRILKYEGQTACSGSDSWIFEGTTKTTYPQFQGKKMSDFTENHEHNNYIINGGYLVRAYFMLHETDINNIINCVSGKDLRSKVYLKTGILSGYYIINEIKDFRANQPTLVELCQARYLPEGLTETDVVISETGTSSTGSTGGGTGGTTASCLITDSGLIATITDDDNWSSGDYTGSTTGLSECNYYIDWTNKIKYEFDGTHLVRFNINTIL